MHQINRLYAIGRIIATLRLIGEAKCYSINRNSCDYSIKRRSMDGPNMNMILSVKPKILENLVLMYQREQCIHIEWKTENF